jgi:acyl-CoA reductase-like NAD-dependent aldehyde dehydrogenase
VAKASEFTPGTTTRLIQMLGEAGLPDGVANIVHGRGDIGAHLGTHPGTDMTSFTGSTAVGKAVMRAAADTLKHVSLELGGKNPQVVLADADLEKAVESVSWAAWFNQGECCNAGSRLLVQTEIADEFVQRLIELTRDVRTGDPLAEDTDVGAIISDQHLERIDGYVRTGGGRVVAGGNRLTTDIGRYYAPTVLDDVTPGSPVATEEIFGPVLSVLRFDDLADAVRLTNDNGYGLSSGVWTRDVDAAISYARAVRAGTVWINDWMAGFPEVPFGGVGQSGIGRELGRSALDEFTESKSIVLRAGAAIGVRGTRVNTTPGSA